MSNTSLEHMIQIQTENLELQKVMQMAMNVADSKATVLVTGESGTGKELLSKFIHQNSNRAKNRFVAVNCAAVPEGLLESELFGHEQGAFTGATSSKPGKFELADKGTLLLDEIGEMNLLLQSKLLRVIQEGEIERVGATSIKKVDVRIIAATNRDIVKMVREGMFREDLYYRLNVIPLVIPPLRSRPDDLEMLSKHFLRRHAEKNDRPLKTLSIDALDKIKQWSWPGNVRELENVLERAALLSVGSLIEEDDLAIGSGAVSRDQDLRPGMTVHELEKRLILKTLDHTGQNRTHAAKMLGISIRTLRNKINEYKRDVV